MIRYVEMKCSLTGWDTENRPLSQEFHLKPVGAFSLDELYTCYTRSFGQGDAKFFFLQDENERREYFETLGFEEVGDDPSSFVLVKQGEIIGFSITLKRGEETNRHISCMCILPAYQGQGLGKWMLYHIVEEALKQSASTLTLGTEPGMKAFSLYNHNGFKVTAEHIIE